MIKFLSKAIYLHGVNMTFNDGDWPISCHTYWPSGKLRKHVLCKHLVYRDLTTEISNNADSDVMPQRGIYNWQCLVTRTMTHLKRCSSKFYLHCQCKYCNWQNYKKQQIICSGFIIRIFGCPSGNWHRQIRLSGWLFGCPGLRDKR
jgi:hypothetical protein